MFKKQHPPPGSRPGTYVPSPDASASVVTAIWYTVDEVETAKISDLSELNRYRDQEGVLWVDVQGLRDVGVIERIAQTFSIHPLALEDVVNVPQRPKTETYDEHELYISRMVKLGEQRKVEIEQVAVLFSREYVVTFQEQPGDVFDPVRERIRQRGSRLRESGADYLAYRIIDTIIDHYYPAIDGISEALEALESRVMNHPTPRTLGEVNRMKQTLLDLRRGIWPQRDAINALVRGDSEYVSEPVRMYFRDSYDHAVQITEVIETYREITAGLFNTYLSVVSNRMNEVMKVLTIMASIFIPLTFMAGIYGMNFEGMPELRMWWSYPLLLMLMAIVAGGMLMYFRRKGWLGNADAEQDGDVTKNQD